MSSNDDDARTSAAAARYVPATGDTSLTINLFDDSDFVDQAGRNAALVNTPARRSVFVDELVGNIDKL